MLVATAYLDAETTFSSGSMLKEDQTTTFFPTQIPSPGDPSTYWRLCGAKDIRPHSVFQTLEALVDTKVLHFAMLNN